MESTDQPNRTSVASDDATTALGSPSRETNGSSDAVGVVPARRGSKIATVSHTLDAAIADRLRHFAFRQRMSESAVIEFALRNLFEGADDVELGTRLRESGAALRRKT